MHGVHEHLFIVGALPVYWTLCDEYIRACAIRSLYTSIIGSATTRFKMVLQMFIIFSCFNAVVGTSEYIRNCSRHLHYDWQSNGENKGNRCPPWYVMDIEGNCSPGSHLGYLIQTVPGTDQTWLQASHCMTTSDANHENRTDVVGSCLYTVLSALPVSLTYYPLPCNASKLNQYMCAGLNREGQLCGRCVKGYAPPVFSYSLSCVNCTDYHLNWLRYIGAAFGPLTIFCLLICVFHINAMSGYLYGFVFFCQIVTMPTVFRITLTAGWYEQSYAVKDSEAAYISLFSIWNLDIFRMFYDPFCLHPRMTVIQALALDYLIAVYPLALLLVAYSLVSLHSRNVGIVVTVWKPFRAVLSPFIRQLDLQTSLIESFATLYFLSAMKVQTVTLDLLSPTTLFFVDGRTSDKAYLLLAGDVEYFGRDHLPYALLALLFLLLLPSLLLFLYPCGIFQRFLNKTNLNLISLKIFMDAYQGNYKDGTNDTRDYRFFSGIFFLTRFIIVAIIVLLSSRYSLIVIVTLLTTLGFSVAILRPQRTKIHYLLDCIVLVLLSLLFFTAMSYLLIQSKTSSALSLVFTFFTFTLPLIHVICLALYWVWRRKWMPKRLRQYVTRRMRSLVCTPSNEEQRLVVD